MTGQGFRNTTSRPTPEWESSVRAQVDRVLASAKLRVPPRRRRLLRYLVDRTLKGESGEITEYAIALDVFERPPSFDPKTDAIVRAEIGRLRQTLADYYAGRGSGSPVLPRS